MCATGRLKTHRYVLEAALDGASEDPLYVRQTAIDGGPEDSSLCTA
jgi:hypothetical protein